MGAPDINIVGAVGGGSTVGLVVGLWVGHVGDVEGDHVLNDLVGPILGALVYEVGRKVGDLVVGAAVGVGGGVVGGTVGEEDGLHVANESVGPTEGALVMLEGEPDGA